MKCILHIGAEKTGTTSIQHALAEDAEALSRMGVFVSKAFGTNQQVFASMLVDGLDDWCYQKRITSEEHKSDYMNKFVRAFSNEVNQAKKSHHTIVISSEHFHSRLCSADLIKDFLRFLTKYFDAFLVIGYFREQTSLAVSRYSTALRAEGITQTLPEFLAEVNIMDWYYNYSLVANAWANVFGFENCRFRDFDISKSSTRGIVDDFYAAIGVLGDASLGAEVSKKNESLNAYQCELLRRANQYIKPWNHNKRGRSNYHKLVKSLIESIETPSHKRYRPSRSMGVYDRFLFVNQELFKNFDMGVTQFAAPARYIAFSPVFYDNEFMMIEGLFKALSQKNFGIMTPDQSLDIYGIATKILQSKDVNYRDSLNLLTISLTNPLTAKRSDAVMTSFIKLRKEKLVKGNQLTKHILVGTNHKTGTVWLKRVFEKFSVLADIPFINISRKVMSAQKARETLASILASDQRYIVFDSHSYFPGLDDKHMIISTGVRIVRSPSDVLISCALYHQWSKEKWLHKPQAKFGGLSYAQAIHQCESIRDKMEFEMNNAAQSIIQKMAAFKSRGIFRTIKFENLMVDDKLELVFMLCRHFDLNGKLTAMLMDAFYQNSLFGNMRDDMSPHIQSEEQKKVYRLVFDDQLKAIFDEKFRGEIAALRY